MGAKLVGNIALTIISLVMIAGLLYLFDALNVLWVLIVFPVILSPELIRGFYQFIKGKNEN